ncbi:hypothetical protein PsorP6_012146 [Peronosclerospora sorghi]|uniref:Uncharacterized protein n=1 Tax=Peronosclerospora sorghi TaxID=230839 RepID=A0ACC0WKD4_9STRA|nr:hypothetical protein PsorP6_012146 [Peronosclerospora sorghi]
MFVCPSAGCQAHRAFHGARRNLYFQPALTGPPQALRWESLVSEKIKMSSSPCSVSILDFPLHREVLADLITFGMHILYFQTLLVFMSEWLQEANDHCRGFSKMFCQPARPKLMCQWLEYKSAYPKRDLRSNARCEKYCRRRKNLRDRLGISKYRLEDLAKTRKMSTCANAYPLRLRWRG